MFDGFSPKTIDFLWGIGFHNERSWFEEHRQEYLENVQTPLRALAEETAAEFLPAVRDLPLELHVSRIYRDARRLHGRGPYKNHLWFTLYEPKEDKWASVPAYYFEIAPNYYSYGMGYYAPRPLTMAKFRARMDDRPAEMARLARSFARQRTFVLEGQEYARPKGQPDRLFLPWYNRKELSLTCTRDPDETLFSPKIREDVTAGFRYLTPFYRYLSTLDADPDPL